MQVILPRHSDFTNVVKLKKMPDCFSVVDYEQINAHNKQVKIVNIPATYEFAEKLQKHCSALYGDFEQPIYEFVLNFLEKVLLEASYVISNKTYAVSLWKVWVNYKTKSKRTISLGEDETKDLKKQVEEYLQNAENANFIKEQVEKEERLKAKKRSYPYIG